MNPFIFYESDIDSDLISKYYGNNLTSGIYAIPEDSVNPPEDQINNNDNKLMINPDGDADTTEFQQKEEDRQNLINTLASSPPFQNQISQMSPEDQQKFNYEATPLKKIYLLNKLMSLSTLLRNNYMMDTDIELLIKFGSSLSYETLLVLSLNIISKLKQEAINTQQNINNSTTNNEENNVESI